MSSSHGDQPQPDYRLQTDSNIGKFLHHYTDCAVAGAGLSGVAAFVSLRCHAANSGGFSTAEPGPAWQLGSLAAGNLAQLCVHHWLLTSVPGHQGGPGHVSRPRSREAAEQELPCLGCGSYIPQLSEKHHRII